MTFREAPAQPHDAVPQVFREPSVDTKAVIASGLDTILVAFRGTASWANVVKDLQARSLAHRLACGRLSSCIRMYVMRTTGVGSAELSVQQRFAQVRSGKRAHVLDAV